MCEIDLGRRSSRLGALALIALLLWLAGCGRQQGDRPPNILFLIADEMRFDSLGVAGGRFAKTPSLDNLARQGILFTRAYAASPVCSPDRATLFTGRYPPSHGVTFIGKPFAPDQVILPALLRKHGYVTGISGKLHLPSSPDWFDHEWITSGGSGRAYRLFLRERVPEFAGSSNTAAVPETLIGPPRTPLLIGTSVLPESLYEEAWVADRGIEFLRDRSRDAKPWFLFVSMLKPHSEFVIPEPYATMYGPDDVELPKTFVPGRPTPAHISNPRHFINDEFVLRHAIAHYHGAVSLVDRHMGRVLDELDRLGMAEDTIVLFTSDHGNMLGERNRMFKGIMYESAVRVPQMIRFPSRLPTGVVNEVVHDHTAIMPTLLELAGIEIPSDVEGRSLVSVIDGDEATDDSMAFAILRDRMVVLGDWKLVDPRGGVVQRPDPQPPRTPELYNRASDPNEQINLYGVPEFAGIQHRLERALLEKWGPPVLPGDR